MYGTAALVSLLAAMTFLSLILALRPAILKKMQPPQRVPIPVMAEEEERRRRNAQ